MYELVPFRAVQLFYNLDRKINGGKCTCLTMQIDFIFEKMSKIIGKSMWTLRSRKSPEIWLK